MKINKEQNEQDIFLTLINNPKLSYWFATLLVQQQTESPDDKDAVEAMCQLGYVRKINDKWVIEEKGRKIAIMLQSSVAKQRVEIKKSKETTIPESVEAKRGIVRRVLETEKPFFYENEDKVDKLKEIRSPTKDDCDKLLKIIKGDAELTNRFYGKNENEQWMSYLIEAGEFTELPPVEKDGESKTYYRWTQGEYIVAVAGKQPEKVLEIIKDIDTENIRVMRDCLQALGAMPAETTVKGMGLVRRFLNKKIFQDDWFYLGEPAANLMARLAQEEYLDEAFEIAEKLLAVKIKESEYLASWHDLQGRFDDYYYGELVFKYFRVLWEKEGQALRAGRLLIELLDEPIEANRNVPVNKSLLSALEAKMKEMNEEEKEDKEDYDPTSHSYITIPSLARLGNGGDIAEVLVAGICQIGQYLMEKDETQAREYIGLLEEKDKSIFRRIKLHVLRYSKGQECKQDIEKILIEKQYCEDDRIRAEFNVLLSDKWEIISESSHQSYITWAERHGLDDVDNFKKWFLETRKREATDDDIEADNHYLKAQALYCVSDKEDVREIYQEHLRKSKRSEADVRPRVRKVEEWAPGSPEHSPLSLEAMQEKTATEVVEYILDYDSKHPDKSDEEDVWKRRDTKEALANVFKQDVDLRTNEYIEVEKDLIIGISRRFIHNYLYSLAEALNSQKLKKPNWDKILAILNALVRTKGLTKEYRSISEVVIRVLERGFKVETCKLPVEKKAMEIIWEILTQLLDYLEEGDVEEGGDALTGCINCPPGLAFENIVRFGIYCKNGDEELFNGKYAEKIKETMNHVINDIPLLKVKCVFGVFFNNLCWLAEEWVKTNLDRIFPENNQRDWDGIWGSFVKWSQPSKLGFEISQCKYAHAVDSIEGQMVYQDGKDYNKRLMEHVMLAYWQGWTGLEEGGLVKNLLAKMDDQMRAQACHWLATGFEHLKDRERDEWQTGVEKRLLDYWDWRYKAMEASPAEHQEEAREFTCWVKDTPFDAETALEITEKAMETAGGVAKQRRDVGDYVEGLRSIATGRELRVMRLLQRAIKDQDVEQWAWDYERVKNPLVALMDQIVELGDNSDTKDIRQIAIGIADSLGRLGHEYLRPHYDRLTQNENRVG